MAAVIGLLTGPLGPLGPGLGGALMPGRMQLLIEKSGIHLFWDLVGSSPLPLGVFIAPGPRPGRASDPGSPPLTRYGPGSS